MKTGTSPRLLGRSIDFSAMERQDGDGEISRFAFHDTRGEPVFSPDYPEIFRHPSVVTAADQRPCYAVSTGEETRSIVERNLHRSPLYSGAIGGRGPRYCPSIEDKFVKFPHHPSHRLFLEPEGITGDEWYINGLSTSLPYEVQEELVHSIPGLSRAQIVRPAYAVEYDYFPPTQLFATLESKVIENLFLAGQVNGTSGYEEAAAQGLLAGINGAAKLQGMEPLVLQRHSAYIGVLIDDLVTKGTEEPYRMFTGRAEFRLLLNGGSAELRLLAAAERHRLLDSGRLSRIEKKRKNIENAVEELGKKGAVGGAVVGGGLENYTAEEGEEILYRLTYAAYWERDRRQMERLGAMGDVPIAEDFDYASVAGLRLESRQKLREIRPRTLGQAGRIGGVGPGDVGLIWVAMEAERRRKERPGEGQPPSS
jgi:tRNA uridine 5-carboxymethylaminomethyl modification enzyme